MQLTPQETWQMHQIYHWIQTHASCQPAIQVQWWILQARSGSVNQYSLPFSSIHSAVKRLWAPIMALSSTSVLRQTSTGSCCCSHDETICKHLKQTLHIDTMFCGLSVALALFHKQLSTNIITIETKGWMYWLTLGCDSLRSSNHFTIISMGNTANSKFINIAPCPRFRWGSTYALSPLGAWYVIFVAFSSSLMCSHPSFSVAILAFFLVVLAFARSWTSSNKDCRLHGTSSIGIITWQSMQVERWSRHSKEHSEFAQIFFSDWWFIEQVFTYQRCTCLQQYTPTWQQKGTSFATLARAPIYGPTVSHSQFRCSDSKELQQVVASDMWL